MSQLQQAIDYLKAHHCLSLTPDGVKEQAGLSLTGATLGRKFRAKARAGILLKSYYSNERGEEIATYAYNQSGKK